MKPNEVLRWGEEMDWGLVAAVELVPTLFEGEKMGESSESREHSRMPRAASSSSRGGGRVARDERAMADVGRIKIWVGFSFVISLQET